MEILKFKISEAKERGYQARLAKLALCHPTHLSHILRKQGSLSPDQALALCVFWGFSEIEIDYFLILISLERAQTEALKTRLANEAQKIREDSLQLFSPDAKGSE